MIHEPYKKRILMKITIASFVFTLLSLSSMESRGQVQQVKFDLIKGSNGVSLGKINCIVKDKYGFLWLSDQDNHCVVRFDGTTMVRFQNNPKDPNSLGGDYPECLYGDSLGSIWIGFFGMGLDKFDPGTKTFTHYRHLPNDPESLSNDTVNCLRIDHLGNIWVGTQGGLDLFDPKTRKFRHFKNRMNDTTSLSCNIVRALYEDHEGELWIGTGMFYDNDNTGGLNHFNRQNGTFIRYLNDPKNPNSLINNKVRSIFEDHQGNFWIGTNGDGLHILDRRTGMFTRYTYNAGKPEQLSRPPVINRIDHITFITEDAENKIWIGTMFNGINRYDPETKKITHYGNNTDKTGAFSDNSGWCAYASTDGLVWMATQASNLYRIDLYNYSIPHYGKSRLEGTACFYEEPPSIIWMGTLDGLIWKDLKNGMTKKYLHEPGNPNSLVNNAVNKIIKSKQGDLWLATNAGLDRFDPRSQRFTHYIHNPKDAKSLATNSLLDLVEDRDSNIWVGTVRSGLDKLDTKTGIFTHFTNVPADVSSISGSIVSRLYEDASSDLWVGTYANNGLNRLNRETGKFKRYLHGLNIADIHKDASGIIWVATGNGLFKYDRKSDDFKSLAEGNPELTLGNTGSITPDNDDNLWICAGFGLYKLNQKRNYLAFYGLHNGIIDEPSMLDGNAFKRKDGELYFGDRYGYYSLYPGQLKTPPGKPVLYFSNFWVANEVVKPRNDGPLKESLSNAREIDLAYDQDIFSFSFSSINYRNSAYQKYSYQLEPYDNAWRQALAEDRIQYFKVPPGNYIFHVKTTDGNNGDLIENSIAVIISPPWYTSWWAYIIYGLLFIALVFSVDRFQKARVIKAERERTRAKELVQAKEIEKAYQELKVTQTQLIQSEKMASLGEMTAGIAHEIQNPLNFVNNFSEVNAELAHELVVSLEKGRVDEARDLAGDILSNQEKISEHGRRADSIVKSMLQHSRTSSGHKESTDINALADEYLRLSYHGLRAKDKTFNASLQTDFDQSIGQVNVIPQDIGRVLLNLFNNAFFAVSEKNKLGKEGYEPTVSVSTKKMGDKVEIRVKDNGMGIPEKVKEKIFQPFFTTKPTGQGTGLGLSLSYDIIKAHQGTLTVQSREGEFTEFIIQLPA
jgi:signal transduction histidine kinase/ligand-binding sensor domain-containing protein